MKIYLIRHAESAPDFELDEADWPLSSTGFRQARELASAARSISPAAVYTSPYRRSVDTVRPIAEAHDLEVQVVEDLREKRLAHGFLDDWREEVENSWADFDYCLEGGESSREAYKRGGRALEVIAGRHEPGDRIIVGSHGTLISLILNSLEPSFGYARWAEMGNPDIFLLRWTGELIWDRTARFEEGCTELVRHCLRRTPSAHPEPQETVSELRRALESADTPEDRLRARGRLGDRLRLAPETLDEAVGHLQVALRACSDLGFPRLWISNSLRLAIALQYAGRHQEALSHFEETLAQIRRQQDRPFEDFALQHLGKCLAEAGRLAEAQHCLKEALELRRRAGAVDLANSTIEALDIVQSLLSDQKLLPVRSYPATSNLAP